MNIIQQFIKSLYSPETIAKFRFQKIGKTILYVFFLIFITTIPLAMMLGSTINSIYQNVNTHVQETFPDFIIENGVLQSDTEEPIYIDEGDTHVIFDPTGQYNPSDVDQSENAIALLEREAVIVTNGFPLTINYQEVRIDLTKEQLTELLDSIGGLLPLLISIFIIAYYLFLTAMKFIGIFSLSVITLLLKRNIADQLSYRHGFVLSAYAVTLPTTLFALIDLLGFHIPFSFAIYWVIAITMMSFVLKHIPSKKVEV